METFSSARSVIKRFPGDGLYETFIGADFIEEDRRAATFQIEKAGGNALIAESEGTAGSTPSNDRKKGFSETIKDHPEMKVVLSRTGDFTRQEKEGMVAFLKSPEGEKINVLFSHNDDRALGAIQAIEAAG